jgi:hypothetical protein
MVLSDEVYPTHGDITGRHRTSPHLNTRIGHAESAVNLLQPVFHNGERLNPPFPIRELRDHALAQIAALPEEFKRLRNPEVYHVVLSPTVGELKESMIENPGAT